MDKPARRISDLETTELVRRLCGYMKLEGQCMRALTERGAVVEDLYENTRAAFDDGRNPFGEEDETSAMDWIRFIVHESFNPVFQDPEEELERLQRYLVAASLIATESGALEPDE